MVALGATCMMETWPQGDVMEGGKVVGGRGPISSGGTFSHPWCSGPSSAIIRLLLGVQPSARLAALSIRPAASLAPVHQHDCPDRCSRCQQCHGENWHHADDQHMQARLTVPEGKAAEVCLPAPSGILVAATSKLALDGAPDLAVARSRTSMLCLAMDMKPGSHVVERHS